VFGRIPSPVFPRKAPPHLWAQIVPGVNNELSVHMTEIPSQSQAQVSRVDEAGKDAAGLLTDGMNPSSIEVVDAPLIRAFNLLREFCVSSRCMHIKSTSRDAITKLSIRDTGISGAFPFLLR
jgi:hypothetical protein